eukprot:2932494-Amphidinium_carterae.1
MVVALKDCLFLNIWRPVDATGLDGLPVVIWIHGGGFSFGAGESEQLPSTHVYNGCQMAAKHGVIVVSLNYRLNIFGFATFVQKREFGFGTFAKPDVYDTHWGLKDQREGMRWVQRHVAAFGGDAGLVTLLGESAGGSSVYFHTVAPLSRGLFRAVIMQSGPYLSFPGSLAYPAAFQAQQTLQLGAAIGCTELSIRECLESADAGTLRHLSTFAQGWGVSIDGVELHESPHLIANRPDFSAVPALLGYNTDESTLFTYIQFHAPMNRDQLRERLAILSVPIDLVDR